METGGLVPIAAGIIEQQPLPSWTRRRCSRGENEGKEESAAAFEREIGTPRDASVSSRHREEIHQNVKHTVTIIKFIYFIIKWHMYKHEMATK